MNPDSIVAVVWPRVRVPKRVPAGKENRYRKETPPGLHLLFPLRAAQFGSGIGSRLRRWAFHSWNCTVSLERSISSLQGFLLSWCKNYRVRGLQGKDVVRVLRDAIRRTGVRPSLCLTAAEIGPFIYLRLPPGGNFQSCRTDCGFFSTFELIFWIKGICLVVFVT